MQRPWPHVLLVALLTSVGTTCGCGVEGLPFRRLGARQSGSTEPAEPTRLTVNVSRAVLAENVVDTSLLFGMLKPRRSSSLGFSRGGRVANVLYNVGDFVAEGEILAELEQGDLVNQREDADNALAAAQLQLATYRSQNNRQQIARVQQDIARLSAQQDTLTRELAKGHCVAPYRAQVVERNAEVGDLLPSGRPCFRIFAAAQPIVELNVPAEVASRTEMGQEVWVKHNDELRPATVASLSPELDASSRTQLMTLNLSEVEGGSAWTFGAVVEVQFWIATEASGFWLPYSALQREANGLWSAYVVESEGEAESVGRKILEVIQLEAEYALVRGTLKEGDAYVVDGLNRLVPGQHVVGNLVESNFRQPGPPLRPQGAVE